VTTLRLAGRDRQRRRALHLVGVDQHLDRRIAKPEDHLVDELTAGRDHRGVAPVADIPRNLVKQLVERSASVFVDLDPHRAGRGLPIETLDRLFDRQLGADAGAHMVEQSAGQAAGLGAARRQDQRRGFVIIK
jgi:hypothetical protein